ncbi:site-specific DNA-methyltransferase [Agromyces seonyuensis]|uniref:DNA-methyltransferase n=1 Tax=Agromyces seonyuensis TaxID=2662446 RepID=UPI0030150749
MTVQPEPRTPGPIALDDAWDLVVAGDNLPVLRDLPDEAFRLVYLDPPFNSGRVQTRQSITHIRSDAGTRIGFQGRSYEVVKGRALSYRDRFDDYWGFLEPRIAELHRLLAADGVLVLHLDAGEVHYARLALDALFGAEQFVAEIVWAYDYGARSTKRWPAKHDNLLVYAKDARRFRFDGAAAAAERFTAPGLSTESDRDAGALPSDVWWHTIVSTTGREKTGYPTQKPIGVLRRLIGALTEPGDLVLDPFAGSGTAGDAARRLERRFVMIDEHPDAVEVMAKRFGDGMLGRRVRYLAA